MGSLHLQFGSQVGQRPRWSRRLAVVSRIKEISSTFVLVFVAMAALSAKKSGLLYDFVSASQGFYHPPVLAGARSRVNVTMRICNSSGPSTGLEEKFVEEAKKAKIIHINGHRSVGGLRASLYNAVTVKNTEVLIAFMKKFMVENCSEP